MKLKNRVIDMEENGQDQNPYEELHYMIHTALKSASKHISKDEMWALCYACNFPYSEYITEEGEVK